MIVTKTPLRISFFSGGSDMPSFFEKEDGAALSVTINKFIHVFMHRAPHMGVKAMYDSVEELYDVEQMQHAITRESLKYFGISKEITTASISDIASRGSGLGSSSAFTVGLVKALSSVGHDNFTRDQLAEVACQIEMVRCGYPVGKQDQYAAAFGGLNLFEFKKNGSVKVHDYSLANPNVTKLAKNLMLVYSGRGRDANNILQKQQKAMSNVDKFNLVRASRDKAYTARDLLMNGKIDDFGALLHEGWMDKKNVCADITQNYFDVIYNQVRAAGALGGKLLGAGGGGFFIFYVPEKHKESVSFTLEKNHPACKIYDFDFYGSGSSIVYHQI